MAFLRLPVCYNIRATDKINEKTTGENNHEKDEKSNRIVSDAGPGFRRTRRIRTDGALTRRAPAYKPGVLNTGDTVSFETTDLDGNPVSSAELFSGSRIRMVGEVKGARVDQYVPTLEAALEQLGQS